MAAPASRGRKAGRRSAPREAGRPRLDVAVVSLDAPPGQVCRTLVDVAAGGARSVVLTQAASFQGFAEASLPAAVADVLRVLGLAWRRAEPRGEPAITGARRPAAAPGPLRIIVDGTDRSGTCGRLRSGRVLSGIVTEGARLRPARGGPVFELVDLVQGSPWDSRDPVVRFATWPEVDLAAGDMVVEALSPAGVVSRFTALARADTVIQPGAARVAACGGVVAATIESVEPLLEGEGGRLAWCRIATRSPVFADPFALCPSTGLMALQSGAGEALGRLVVAGVFAAGVEPQARAGLKRQKPGIVWLGAEPPGWAGAVAASLSLRLGEAGYAVARLDDVRLADLAGPAADSDEAARLRLLVALGGLLCEAGLIVLSELDDSDTARRTGLATALGHHRVLDVQGMRPSGEAGPRGGDVATAIADVPARWPSFAAADDPVLAAEQIMRELGRLGWIGTVGRT